MSVADIIIAVDEPLDATQCGGKENCQDERLRCMTHELWATLNKRMVEYLDSVSLQDLVDQQEARTAGADRQIVGAARAQGGTRVADLHLQPIDADGTRSIRERGMRVRSSMSQPIYIDYSATTPIDPRVADKMIPYLREQFGNPASRSHVYGWTAEKAVEEARAQVAALVNCDPREIIWTSGATESTTSR